MHIKQLVIKNFRNIEKADLRLDKNTLLVGANNIGKSTILEALDLLLGPDRLYSLDAINEHDFYASTYLDKDSNPISITIECCLIGLNDRQRRLFSKHIEYWDTQDDKFISMDELPEVFDENKYRLDCLRVAFEGYYDKEEDEFITKTFFPHPASHNIERSEKYDSISKNEKREIGYLYLRIIRTGSRALSLERGSLLDLILRLKEIKPSSYDKILTDLRALGKTMDTNTDFRNILEQIENKVKKYTPLVSSNNKSTEFEITNLTRKNLRQTLNLFIGTEPSNVLVPYRNVGSGTINILLLALMTFIADLKKENNKNVVFAMEEPEIAMPPYTQRKIIDELISVSDQVFITSHSPYVAEKFLKHTVLVLKNDKSNLTGYAVDYSSIKEKTVRRNFRTQFAEGILSKGILAVEGISDELVLYQTSEKLSSFDKSYIQLDTAGISIVNNNGDNNLNLTGAFFAKLNVKTYAFCDKIATIEEKYFSLYKKHDQNGLEKLLIEELPDTVLGNFFDKCKSYQNYPKHIALTSNLKDDVFNILRARKAEGYAARLIDFCNSKNDLPKTIVEFLQKITNDIIK